MTVVEGTAGGRLVNLLVASADGQAFRTPVDDIPRSGTGVGALGFREHASCALASDTLDFVDLENIPGVFRYPGARRKPCWPLSSLLTSRL